MSTLTEKARILHWVFKVADRTATIKFYREVLGMRVLRHEEFAEGCEASCNGPYDGKWSKTMIGYGDEDEHFVLELTYNYGVKKYDLGNDFAHIGIKSSRAVQSAVSGGVGEELTGGGKKVCIRSRTINQRAWSRPLVSGGVGEELTGGGKKVCAPDGYTFTLLPDSPAEQAPLTLNLNVTNLNASLAYWRDLLGMQVVTQSETSCSLKCGNGKTPCELVLCSLPAGVSLDHGTAYGRVAFSCPSSQLKVIEAAVVEKGFKVLTPFLSLDTPGKATVQVVILADPDGYEICFVGDEGFRELSKTDPQGDELLDTAMQSDDSVAWFENKAAKKAARENKETCYT